MSTTEPMRPWEKCRWELERWPQESEFVGTSAGAVSVKEALGCLDAMPDKATMLRAVGATSFSDRRVDHTLRKLKGMGLCGFNYTLRLWIATRSEGE